MDTNNNQTKKLTSLAQKLRKTMTKEERHLWYEFLKDLPITINRQKVIGPYIVDFYCTNAKMVIELDGSQHFDDIGKSKDLERDKFLADLGIAVKRYSNNEVNEDFEAVCCDIYNFLFPEDK